jgi:DNA-directed RNA polymerase specialized sigma subunit
MRKIKTKWADFDQKIIQLYVEENKTRKEIAKILDIPESGVDSRIRLLGLTKTKEQIRQNISKAGTKYFVDETVLSQLYLGENKTQKEIAKILDVPTKAIDSRVHKLGLKKTKDQLKKVSGRKKDNREQN